MRLDRAALILFLGLPSQLLGFAPQTLSKRQHVPEKSQVVVFQYPDDPSSDWGDEPGDNEEIIGATKSLLETSKTAEGLSAEALDDFFPLMLWWGKTSTREGAEQVEQLLSHLEDVIIKAGITTPEPTCKYYTLAVDAWGKAGYPEKAKRILSRMEDLSASDSSLAPTRVTYNAMMNAYIKQGDTESAGKILDSMEKSSGLTTIINDYNVLLAGYAKVGQAREAEQLVKRMISLCREEKNDDLKPDLYSYNTLIDAWAKSNEPGRGRRVQEILTTLIDKHESGEFEWSPDGRTFSSAITALARSGGTMEQIEKIWSDATARGLGLGSDPYMSSALLHAYANSSSRGSAEKAEEILEKLEQEGLATYVAYNTVLKAWKAKGNEEATQRAEKLFKRMKSLDLVDAFSYCTLIAIHANLGNRQSAERAEELLDGMKADSLVPNVETMNAVMNAWTRCGKIERAERILKDMEESFYNGSTEGRIAPNVVSYTTLMNGWAKSRDPQAVEKTRETFERMRAMYKCGNVEAQPNLVSYATLVNSISRSEQPGSAEKAEEILHQMYEEYKSGSIAVPPNARLVTSVIDSWQKSGDRNAGERAEDLLDWLLEIYEAEGIDSLQPNEYTFNSVISAWARTRKFGKAARAKAILNRMVELKETGVITAVPNAHCYTSVINSCAYCEKDSLEKRQALRIAIETYKEMLASGAEGPNQLTFSTLVAALRNLMPPDEKRAAAIQTVFKKCADDGQVSDLFLRRVQSSLNMDQLITLVGNDVISLEGRVDINQIPSKWRRNTSEAKTKQPVIISR